MNFADSRPATVRVILPGEAKSCRLIAEVSAESAHPYDLDLYDTAVGRAQVIAAQKGGNALSVFAYQIRSVPSANDSAFVMANAYECK